MTHSVLARFLLISLLAHAGVLLLWPDVRSVPIPAPPGGALQLALQPPLRDPAQKADAASPPGIESARTAAREKGTGAAAVVSNPNPNSERKQTETRAVDILIPGSGEGRAGRDAGVVDDHAGEVRGDAILSFPIAAEIGDAEVRARLGEAVETHFYYPPLARRRGWEGEVVVGVRVEGDGRLSAIDVVASSGYRVLDHAAVDSLARLARLPDAGGLPASGIEVTVPVIYRLVDRPV